MKKKNAELLMANVLKSISQFVNIMKEQTKMSANQLFHQIILINVFIQEEYAKKSKKLHAQNLQKEMMNIIARIFNQLKTINIVFLQIVNVKNLLINVVIIKKQMNQYAIQ